MNTFVLFYTTDFLSVSVSVNVPLAIDLSNEMTSYDDAAFRFHLCTKTEKTI